MRNYIILLIFVCLGLACSSTNQQKRSQMGSGHFRASEMKKLKDSITREVSSIKDLKGCPNLEGRYKCLYSLVPDNQFVETLDIRQTEDVDKVDITYEINSEIKGILLPEEGANLEEKPFKHSQQELYRVGEKVLDSHSDGFSIVNRAYCDEGTLTMASGDVYNGRLYDFGVTSMKKEKKGLKVVALRFVDPEGRGRVEDFDWQHMVIQCQPSP